LHQYQVVQNYSIRVALTPNGKTMAKLGALQSARRRRHQQRAGPHHPALDVQSGKEIKKAGARSAIPSNAATFSPDGKTLAVSSGMATYHSFDVEKGKRRAGMSAAAVSQPSCVIRPTARPCMRHHGRGRASLGSRDRQKAQSRRSPVRAATHLAFPEKGPVLALSSMGPALHLWDAATGKSSSPTRGITTRSPRFVSPTRRSSPAGADVRLLVGSHQRKELRHLIARDDDTLR